MAKKESGAKFINAQAFPVTIHDEERRQFVVDPYRENGRKPNAIYVVEGEFYRQFVSTMGPLAPLPQEEAVAAPPPPKPAPESAAAPAKAASGKPAPKSGPDADAAKAAPTKEEEEEVKPKGGNLKGKAKSDK